MPRILDTIRWISIGLGALSLFYLANTWLNLGLTGVFERIHYWYASIVHPVVDLLKPLAEGLFNWLGWSLPHWWRDAVVLYVAIGGATIRGTREGIVLHLPQWRVNRLATTRKSLFVFLFWPAYWVRDAFRNVRYYFTRKWRMNFFVITHSSLEFAKILAGALILGLLNAGLA